MDFLNRYVTPKVFLLLLLAVTALRLTYTQRSLLANSYRAWRHPPVGGPARPGNDMIEQAHRREAIHVDQRYFKILARLGQARAEGFNVRALEQKARAALALNTMSHRRRAIKLLNEVEMAIPRKPDGRAFASASPAATEEIEPDIAPSKRRRR